jgi:hypothetical protein
LGSAVSIPKASKARRKFVDDAAHWQRVAKRYKLAEKK